MFSYSFFFIFLSLLIILNFDASDVGMYVENDCINYTNWIRNTVLLFHACIIAWRLSVLQDGRPGDRGLISGKDKRVLSPPQSPHWLLISASLLYDGCHTIYSLVCISRMGLRRQLMGGKGHPITGLDKPLGIQKVDAPRFSRQSANEGGKLSSRTYRLPLSTRTYCRYAFLLHAESIPWP